MAVTILPARCPTAITDGTLTLAAATVAASLADLGPEHVDAVCERLAGPRQVADDYRRDVRRRAEYDTIVARHADAGGVVFHDDNAAPSTARRLSALGFDDSHTTAHGAEPCNAVVISKGWSEHPVVEPVCTEPKRHRPTPQRSRTGLAARRPERRTVVGWQRLTREATCSSCPSRPRYGGVRPAPGGFIPNELTEFTLTVLIDEAGHDALTYAAQVLAVDTSDSYRIGEILAAQFAESPAKLARIAVAVACGIAESRSYHSTGPTVAGWFRLLAAHGWEPDPWTNTRMHEQASGIEQDDVADGE